MKKINLLLAVVLICFFFLENPGLVQGQEVITLKMADSFPIGHFNYKSSLKFCKRVEELSNNKVKIEYYPAEQLGKLKDLLTLTGKGLVDIAYVPPSFFVGQVPLQSVMILPFWTTAAEGQEIYYRLMEACPELRQEFEKYGVRPLRVYSTSQYDVGTAKKPVRSPEDLKGLKLKTSGGIFDYIAKQYGVIPVTIPGPEMYEALQRGVIEGCILSYPSTKGYRVNELEKYHTLGLRLGGYPSTYTINEKKWKNLPQDVQKVLLQAAKEADEEFGKGWGEEELMLAEQFKKEGMVIYRVSSKTERAKWGAPLKGIEEIWIKDMEKKGLPGKKIFENFQKICEQVAK